MLTLIRLRLKDCDVKHGEARSMCLCNDDVESGNFSSSFLWCSWGTLLKVLSEKVCSLAVFSATTTRQKLSVSFREGKEILRMVIALFGRENPVIEGKFALVARLLNVFSLDAAIISCRC